MKKPANEMLTCDTVCNKKIPWQDMPRLEQAYRKNCLRHLQRKKQEANYRLPMRNPSEFQLCTVLVYYRMQKRCFSKVDDCITY